jgi:hypothetical protein
VRCLILRISGCGGQECVGFPIFACGSVLFESYLLCFVLLDSGSLSLSLSLSRYLYALGFLLLLLLVPITKGRSAAATGGRRQDKRRGEERAEQEQEPCPGDQSFLMSSRSFVSIFVRPRLPAPPHGTPPPPPATSTLPWFGQENNPF